MIPNVRVEGGSEVATSNTHIAKVSLEVSACTACVCMSVCVCVYCMCVCVYCMCVCVYECVCVCVLQDGCIQQESYSSLQTGPLVNLLASQGRPGKV